ETRGIEIIEAAHPVPYAAGLAAAKRLMETVNGLTEDDLVIVIGGLCCVGVDGDVGLSVILGLQNQQGALAAPQPTA
ncbi:DUF4147 domain-containing protein, partial [Rhizobium ruizarguesonis]